MPKHLSRILAQPLPAATLAVVAVPLHAADLPGYAVGTGDGVAQLVVDFAFYGGDSYTFDYFYDAEAGPDTTARDLLVALDDAGPLEVGFKEFSFGSAIQTLDFAGFSLDFSGSLVFPATSGETAALFDAAEVDAASDWISSSTGVDGLLLDNTPVIGLSFYDFFAGSADAPGVPLPVGVAPAIPEPATAGLLVAGGLLMLRRRSA